MYVWDEANNFDFCDVTLIIQKNSACAGSSPGNRIAGDISTDRNEMIRDVNVTLRHMESQETTSIVTDQSGRFEFGDMKTGKGYNIIPAKNDDHLNGVSTLDLVMMQRHILDIEKLNSPYKYIAADVNRDNKITAGDLVELRKLILGIYASLPNNTSWRFIDKSSPITDPNNPWNINEYITLPSMSSSSLDNHFMGIKTGDINGSVVVNANSTKTENRNKALTLQVDNKEFMPGQKVRVDFTSDNFTNITGAQWTLNFDASALEYADLISGAMVMGNDNINTLAAHDGKIAFSWNDFNGMTVSDDKVLFSIEFRATTNNTINKTVSMSSDITKAEAYTTELGEAKMNLNIRTAKVGDKVFTLGQNNPNPFTTNTTISFNLPEAGPATLTIYDITGKVLKSYSKEYAKGRNEVIINSEEINAQGVMFYELESKGVKATKKMIYLSK
ncbi:MAG: T9SS type A sorting domain-containing protein [Saprospiraceae bacterium]|nr:T9SS type A sorting domain-containing protein [Saprospiraceae bacterium]